jgi:hypothetical protein
MNIDWAFKRGRGRSPHDFVFVDFGWKNKKRENVHVMAII